VTGGAIPTGSVTFKYGATTLGTADLNANGTATFSKTALAVGSYSAITATYAGLRAATEHSDYLIDVDTAQRYVLVGGIRSTGLTSGLAVAEYVEQCLADEDALPAAKPELPEPPRMPNLGEAFLRPYQDARRIADDPAYGAVVCFCERVTAGEIRDTFATLIPPTTPEGLRRRTRAMNGRCQGFYCGAEVASLAERYDTGGAP
jgi:glycerol-3-phosphate dehydrogenase